MEWGCPRFGKPPFRSVILFHVRSLEDRPKPPQTSRFRIHHGFLRLSKFHKIFILGLHTGGKRNRSIWIQQQEEQEIHKARHCGGRLQLVEEDRDDGCELELLKVGKDQKTCKVLIEVLEDFSTVEFVYWMGILDKWG